jgi:hypothetical protein
VCNVSVILYCFGCLKNPNMLKSGLIIVQRDEWTQFWKPSLCDANFDARLQACVQCSRTKCARAYHVTCALSQGLVRYDWSKYPGHAAFKSYCTHGHVPLDERRMSVRGNIFASALVSDAQRCVSCRGLICIVRAMCILFAAHAVRFLVHCAPKTYMPALPLRRSHPPL